MQNFWFRGPDFKAIEIDVEERATPFGQQVAGPLELPQLAHGVRQQHEPRLLIPDVPPPPPMLAPSTLLPAPRVLTARSFRWPSRC